MSLPILEDNTVEITPKQLLYVTEGLVRYHFKHGRRDLPIPTEEDIWAMMDALNFTLWLCPDTGHQAVKLLNEKYGEIQEKIARISAEL